MRFYNIHPLEISWRLFKNLIFSLVSEESSFYAPYMKELYEDMKEEYSQKELETPKVQVSLEDAMKDLGMSNG